MLLAKGGCLRHSGAKAPRSSVPGISGVCASPKRPPVRRAPLWTPHIGRSSRFVAVKAAESDEIEYVEPDFAKEAIDLGLQYCSKGRWGEALPIFERALTLPGTGTKRFRDKPPLISDGEKGAAYYNIACCQAQLGDTRSALVALARCLETGYSDFAQIRSDPDFTPLRSDERFEGLMLRFEPRAQSGLFGLDLGSLFGGKN